jgi:hypothetical protein
LRGDLNPAVAKQRRLVAENPKHFKEIEVDSDEVVRTSAKIETIINSPAACSLHEAVLASNKKFAALMPAG